MRRSALVVFPALALVVSAGCADAASRPVPTAPLLSAVSLTGAPATVGPAPAPAAPAKGSTADTALSLLASVRVARENPNGYQRTKFRHWVDADGDGCDTREEVLIAESSSTPQVMWPGCKVIEGDWVSRYDGVSVTDPSGLDIDHFVPLKEAWDSGAHSWTASRRQQFANDMSDPRALVAVTASTNRSKGDKDPPQWMPPDPADFCGYLADWVAVKSHWQLTMDESEQRFIDKRLRGQCAGATVTPWGSTSNPATVPGTASPSSSVQQGAGSGSTPSVNVSTTVTPSPATTELPDPVDTVAKGALPTIHPGSWCTPKGAFGTYKGLSYVCATTKATGEPYADNRAHWRRG